MRSPRLELDGSTFGHGDSPKHATAAALLEEVDARFHGLTPTSPREVLYVAPDDDPCAGYPLYADAVSLQDLQRDARPHEVSVLLDELVLALQNWDRDCPGAAGRWLTAHHLWALAHSHAADH